MGRSGGKATLTDLSAHEARCLLDYLATPPGTPEESDARNRLAAAMRDASDDDAEDAIDSFVTAAIQANWLRHPARQ
jgi:predicted RNase H-like nuclease